ncbi:MAG: signal peptidase I [Bacilli bacterium]|nr:signal peptidase I [Bacilli bacterium]
MKNKKLISDLLSYILPMVLIVPISVLSIYQAQKNTFDRFFVIGSSMAPTLEGSNEKSTYGLTDNSAHAIDNIEHFDLVVCYYPFESSLDYTQPYVRGSSTLTNQASLKVKRVIGLPGDHLVINNDVFTIESTINNKVVSTTYSGNVVKMNGDKKEVSEKVFEDHVLPSFLRKGHIEDRRCDITLGEDEYFVMGDNWSHNGSTDCCNPTAYSPAAPIYKENIEGVIFKLVGECTYGTLKHCADCSTKVDENDTKCKCGGTKFVYFDDIISEEPYKDGPVYLK